jgi:hypothetical protein
MTTVYEPTFLLRSVFRRGTAVLTCAVKAITQSSAYDVCILPHWSLAAGTVEHFDAPGSAVVRLAEIALRLRESGWVPEYGA